LGKICLVAAVATIVGVERRSAYVALLSLFLSGVVLFRPNGILFLAGLLVASLVLDRPRLRQTAFASLIAFVAFVGVETVARVAGVGRPSPGFYAVHVVALPLHTLAYALAHDALTNPVTINLVNKIFEPDVVRASFDQFNFSTIVFNGIHHDRVRDHLWSIIIAWVDLAAQQPALASTAFLRFAWTIVVPLYQSPLRIHVFPTGADDPALWNVATGSPVPQFRSAVLAPGVWDLMTAVNIEASSPWGYALLAPSTWIWIGIAAAGIWWARRGTRDDRQAVRAMVALSASLLFLAATAVLIPSPEVRYTWWIYPVTAMASFLALKGGVPSRRRVEV
jgi:hypothetical protein